MAGVTGRRLGNIIAGERDYEGFDYRLLRRWRLGGAYYGIAARLMNILIRLRG